MSEPRSRVLVSLRVAASASKAFRTFTEDIGLWWQPNPIFVFTAGRTGRLSLEAREGGSLMETYDDGSSFEIGKVLVWQPPQRLVMSWRQAAFTDDQQTEVHVRFEAVDDGPGRTDHTRVTVEHYGWDTIPPASAARHGFPLAAFQLRHGEWWRRLLHSFGDRVGS